MVVSKFIKCFASTHAVHERYNTMDVRCHVYLIINSLYLFMSYNHDNDKSLHSVYYKEGIECLQECSREGLLWTFASLSVLTSQPHHFLFVYQTVQILPIFNSYFTRMLFTEFLCEAEFLSVDPYMRLFGNSLPKGATMMGEQVAK